MRPTSSTQAVAFLSVYLVYVALVFVGGKCVRRVKKKKRGFAPNSAGAAIIDETDDDAWFGSVSPYTTYTT